MDFTKKAMDVGAGTHILTKACLVAAEERMWRQGDGLSQCKQTSLRHSGVNTSSSVGYSGGTIISRDGAMTLGTHF